MSHQLFEIHHTVLVLLRCFSIISCGRSGQMRIVFVFILSLCVSVNVFFTNFRKSFNTPILWVIRYAYWNSNLFINTCTANTRWLDAIVYFHALCTMYMCRMMCAPNEITFDWFIRQIQELGGSILLNIYYKYWYKYDLFVSVCACVCAEQTQ